MSAPVGHNEKKKTSIRRVGQNWMPIVGQFSMPIDSLWGNLETILKKGV